MGILLYALDRYGGNRGIAHGHGCDLEEQLCCHRREE